MAEIIDVNSDEAQIITSNESLEDYCLTTEPENASVELPNVTHIPPRNWQIGCNLNECLLNVYKNDRWTDMTIRCVDKEVNRTLKAHKIILAARSPVFEAMLFGPCSDGKTEYDFPDADVDIFDMMLRFLYNDNANLKSVDEATDLMQMAHMYQITCLVDHCALYLHNNITENNVCKSLDCALKYSTPTLRDACCDFIDRNVEDVIQTDGFLEISKEGLTYMLKGDTFFAGEDIIFHRVEQWAKLKLAEGEKEDSGQNIREVLGEAFYHLRLPTLPAVKLMECIKRKGYFSVDEYEDLVDCNLKRQSQLSFVSNVRRVPVEELVTTNSSFSTECKKNYKIVQILHIKIDKDVQLEFIEIPLLRTYMKYSECLFRGELCTERSQTSALFQSSKKQTYNYTEPIEGQNLPTSLNSELSVAVSIDKIQFENRSNIHQLSNESSKIVFDQPVLLKKHESPFELKIEIAPSCKNSQVLLVACNESIPALSRSRVASVPPKKTIVSTPGFTFGSRRDDSMIGINAIGLRHCSFREKTDDLDDMELPGLQLEPEDTEEETE